MSTPNTFTWHCDDSHEWLEVSPAQLKLAGVSIVSFSQFSYRADNGVVYLEGDCDADMFLRNWAVSLLPSPVFSEARVPGMSPIRNLARLAGSAWHGSKFGGRN